MNTQERIIEVIERIRSNRRVAKSIREGIRAECDQSKEYREYAEIVSQNKEKMKRIEVSVCDPKDLQQLDNLKAEIKNDQQVLTDLALNAYTKGENIELDGGDGERYTPTFKAKSARTNLPWACCS